MASVSTRMPNSGTETHVHSSIDLDPRSPLLPPIHNVSSSYMHVVNSSASSGCSSVQLSGDPWRSFLRAHQRDHSRCRSATRHSRGSSNRIADDHSPWLRLNIFPFAPPATRGEVAVPIKVRSSEEWSTGIATHSSFSLEMSPSVLRPRFLHSRRPKHHTSVLALAMSLISKGSH